MSASPKTPHRRADAQRDSRSEFRAEDEPAHADVLAQVMRILGILQRRWLVVAVTTVLCVAAAALTITMLPPRWKASATVLLHMSGPQVLDKVKGVSEDSAARLVGYREYYETQRQIMRSRAVAQKALADLGLATDPAFLGIEDIQSEPERMARAAAIDPIEQLRSLVFVAEIRNSRVVEISAEYPDAQTAADIANAVADAYMMHVRTSRTRLGSDAQDDIALEKISALARVQEAEKSLEDFKTSHRITSIDQLQRHATQDILTLSSASKKSEAERIRLKNMLTQATRLHKAGNHAASNLLSESDRRLFESMRQERLEAERAYEETDVKYGPKHEEHRKATRRLALIDNKLKRESGDLIESLEARLIVAQSNERDLNRSLGREEREALRVTELERGYRELEREATAAAEDYLLIARRDTEIAITNRVEAQGIEILDRAPVPGAPVFPQKLLLLSLGLVAGLGLGSLLAVSIDFRDQRIRGLIDLERALARFGLPVLGQLPQLPADVRLGVGNTRAQRRQRDLYAHLFPQSLMAERCRGVRTSLAFAAGGEKLNTIMITSPSSSEGKSSTAMNLALSFCQANKKVILVDADMRRPRIHQIFPEALDLGDNGLASLLRNRCTLEEALLQAPDDAPSNLSVLPCGAIPDNPAELIDTPDFRRLLTELQNHADLIIIDCPPVLPVTDPLLLARHVDGVVLVGRCDSTTRSELQRAIALLARGDTNLVGVVLNEVDARQERYGYSTEYYTYRAPETQTESV
ncbi:MAG: polysaccharide biosynthesis tyrosine autokinase [Nannocystaceae bacterium]|nr:polysaccharide biosynthesis tyrosine autokinase [Nannocystaceae bacterium]